MKVRFVTLGCKLNFAESSAIGKALLAEGIERALPGETADICVVNTCSVTDAADHKCRQAIHRLRRENPQAVIIATGCYAQLAAERAIGMQEKVGERAIVGQEKMGERAIGGQETVGERVKPAGWEDVDYIVGNDEKFAIPTLVKRLTSASPVVYAHPMREAVAFHSAISFTADEADETGRAVDRSSRTRCFLKVQDGCNFYCSYCTIPYARGRSRNPRIADLTTQAQQALDGGAKEIVLTGVNIADFGHSTGETFVELLRALDHLEGQYRVRIGSCEPDLLRTEIIDYVAHSEHIAPHFHIPLQSGSNEVLKIMRRHYTRELFAERIAYIRAVLPQAFIGVDCMVGVRGETEAYFDDYVSFVKGLAVSQLHVFTYSERAHTRMLEMDLLIVPQEVRKQRSELMHRISDEKLKAFYEQNEGSRLTVLWESKNNKGMMTGFTENYIRVSAPYEAEKVNTFETIIHNSGYCVIR